MQNTAEKGSNRLDQLNGEVAGIECICIQDPPNTVSMMTIIHPLKFL